MFNNILVAYDGSSSSRAAVDRALELAKASNAEVTLLTVAPSVAPLVGLSGVSIEELDAELRQWAGRTAREGASTASNGLNVHTVTRSGHIGEEIVAQIEAGGYDLVVLGSRGRGRLTSELFGSANGYVHFHSRIPLLSISADESNSGVEGETTLAGAAAH
jgi:nucleotide-binding universal stress UspA family protein